MEVRRSWRGERGSAQLSHYSYNSFSAFTVVHDRPQSFTIVHNRSQPFTSVHKRSRPFTSAHHRSVGGHPHPLYGSYIPYAIHQLKSFLSHHLSTGFSFAALARHPIPLRVL